LKKKQKLFSAVLICILALTAAIACSIAFLRSNDEVTNTFSTGTLDILLTETEYPGNFDKKVTAILPYDEVPKNPQVTNLGDNDAFVFLRITVPVADIVTASPKGIKSEQKPQEIFFLKTNQTEKTTFDNSFNQDHWIRLENMENGIETTPQGDTVYLSDTRTYVFGYNSAISTGQTTDAIFDKVQMKNVITDVLGDSEIQTIKVDALGIQADYLKNIDSKTNLSKEKLEEIYTMLNQ